MLKDVQTQSFQFFSLLFSHDLSKHLQTTQCHAGERNIGKKVTLMDLREDCYERLRMDI